MAIDFSDLGGKPVTPSNGPIDFSDLGGQPVESHSLSQKIWQATAAPRNALRGIDTGVESFLEGKGSHQAAIDGIQAMLAAKYLPNQPAPEGSKIAYALSNVQDPRYLPLNFVPGSGYAGAAVKGALAGAEGSALGDLENTGTTTPGSVGTGAVAGGVLGPAAHGTFSALSHAPELVEGATTLGKRLYTAASLLRPGVLNGVESNGAGVKAAVGTAETQRVSAEALQQGIKDRLAQLRQPVEAAKEALGIPHPKMGNYADVVNEAKQVIDSQIPHPAQSPVNFPQPAQAPQSGPMLALPPAGGFTPEMNTIGPTEVTHTPEGFSYYRYRQVEPEFAASAPQTQQSKFAPRLPESFQRPAGQLDGTIPEPAAAESNLDRVRKIAALKEQVNKLQGNLFRNGDTSVLPKDIASSDASGELRSLYGQLNEQMRVIPEAAPLNDANAAFSPAKTAFDDTLQPKFGKQPGVAVARINSLATADPNTPAEALKPDVLKALEAVGGDVPSLYRQAEAESVKRAIGLPVNKANTNAVKLFASSPFRAAYLPAIDGINTLGRALNLPAQAISPLGSAADTMSPNLLAALMAKSKQHQ